MLGRLLHTCGVIPRIRFQVLRTFLRTGNRSHGVADRQARNGSSLSVVVVGCRSSIVSRRRRRPRLLARLVPHEPSEGEGSLDRCQRLRLSNLRPQACRHRSLDTTETLRPRRVPQRPAVPRQRLRSVGGRQSRGGLSAFPVPGNPHNRRFQRCGRPDINRHDGPSAQWQLVPQVARRTFPTDRRRAVVVPRQRCSDVRTGNAVIRPALRPASPRLG